MCLFISRFLHGFLLGPMPLAAPEHKRIPVHGGAPVLPRAALSRPFLDSFRPPRQVTAPSPLLQLPLLQSSVLQRLMCVYVWALGCLLVLTLCLLTFNLDGGVDMPPSGGGHNFLDVRYYPATTAVSHFQIFKSYHNLPCLHTHTHTKKRVCLKHSQSRCD